MTEPLGIFRRLENSFGENVLTEALACVLEVSSVMRASFVRKAIEGYQGPHSAWAIETRPWSQEGTPDLQIRGDNAFLILCEMKVDSPLKYSQWSKYQERLDEHTDIAHKQLIGIVSQWTSIDQRIINSTPGPKIWQWRDIHRLASTTVNRESDPVASFLIRELMSLLEGHSMASFEGFSRDDLRVLERLAGVNSKLEAFLSEVSEGIMKSLDGKTNNAKYEFAY